MADVSVVCAECNRALEITLNPKHDSIEVAPCEDCLADAEEKGRNES